MIQQPMDILGLFPVRKSAKQKRLFRDAIIQYADALGYTSLVEKGAFGSRNVILGDPESAKYLVTAHYDTCAGMIVPNLITPCNFWTFMAYQLFVVLIMILPAAAVGFIVGYLTRSFILGYYIGYLFLWVDILLLMFGPANRNNANDNTSGVVTVMEIARSIPENQRHKVCFVLFDLEEAGLVGSAAYYKKHKNAADSQLVLNLDCVGDGDSILFFPTGKLKKDRRKLALLRKCCGTFGEKTVAVREKGFSVYPSDQANFPYGVGICATKKSRLGLYISRIHTHRDTVLEETNVNILRAALISMISCDAVQ